MNTFENSLDQRDQSRLDPRQLEKERAVQIAQNSQQFINLMKQTAGYIDELRDYERRLVLIGKTPHYKRYAFVWKDSIPPPSVEEITEENNTTWLGRLRSRVKEVLSSTPDPDIGEKDLYQGIAVEVSYAGFNVAYDDPKQQYPEADGTDNYISAKNMTLGTLYDVIRQTIPYAFKSDNHEPRNPNPNILLGQSFHEPLMTWNATAIEPEVVERDEEIL